MFCYTSRSLLFITLLVWGYLPQAAHATATQLVRVIFEEGICHVGGEIVETFWEQTVGLYHYQGSFVFDVDIFNAHARQTTGYDARLWSSGDAWVNPEFEIDGLYLQRTTLIDSVWTPLDGLPILLTFAPCEWVGFWDMFYPDGPTHTDIVVDVVDLAADAAMAGAIATGGGLSWVSAVFTAVDIAFDIEVGVDWDFDVTIGDQAEIILDRSPSLHSLVVNGGHLFVEGNRSINAPFGIRNLGDIYVYSGSQLLLNDSVTNIGILNIDSNGIMQFNGGASLTGGTITGLGQVTLSGCELKSNVFVKGGIRIVPNRYDFTNYGILTLSGEGTRLETENPRNELGTQYVDILGDGELHILDGASAIINGSRYYYYGEQCNYSGRIHNNVVVDDESSITFTTSDSQSRSHQVYGNLESAGNININHPTNIHGAVLNDGVCCITSTCNFDGSLYEGTGATTGSGNLALTSLCGVIRAVGEESNLTWRGNISSNGELLITDGATGYVNIEDLENDGDIRIVGDGSSLVTTYRNNCYSENATISGTGNVDILDGGMLNLVGRYRYYYGVCESVPAVLDCHTTIDNESSVISQCSVIGGGNNVINSINGDIENNGLVSIQNPTRVYGELRNNGELKVNSTVYLSNSSFSGGGKVTGSGKLGLAGFTGNMNLVGENTTMLFEGNMTDQAEVSISDSALAYIKPSGFSNEGTLTLDGQGTRLTTSIGERDGRGLAEISGDGNINVLNGAELNLHGRYRYYYGVEVSMGTSIENDVYIDSNSILTSTLLVNGGGCNVRNFLLGEVINNGVMHVSQPLSCCSRLTNRGEISIQSSFEFTEIDMDGGVITGSTLRVDTDDTLLGTGHVQASVINNGLFIPGRLSGIMGIDGDYSQTGRLVVNMQPNVSTLLSIAGTAELGGTCTIELPEDAMCFEEGQVFTVLHASYVVGRFDETIIPLNGSGMPMFELSYSETDVILTVMPNRMSGDCNGDNLITLDDYRLEGCFVDCFNGPVGSYETPVIASWCQMVFDFNNDADVDLMDFAAFQRLVEN